MAQQSMQLSSIVWDDTKDTATLLFTGLPPAPPASPEGSSWWAGPGATIEVTVPIKRDTTTTNPVGIMATPAVGGGFVYTRYEYVNGQWANPTRVNSDGSPYTDHGRNIDRS